MQKNVIHSNMSVITAICPGLGKNIVFITQNYNLRTYDRESVFFITQALALIQRKREFELRDHSVILITFSMTQSDPIKRNLLL